ncbi:MotE family protein [Devosia honganensis]|uniref:MotE family protein n=1 Tax=Devosia honganensis TaxID=1610527 RepID=A0ABV7X540_9HYPH
MTNIRLLPVVILAAAALLVLKTVGLATNGGYVLQGPGVALAATAQPETVSLPAEPTIEDASPTLADETPTLELEQDAGRLDEVLEETFAPSGGEGGFNPVAVNNACAPRPAEGTDAEGLLLLPADCPPPADAQPLLVTPDGAVPLNAGEATVTERAVLERLAARRTELEGYEQELAMRASLVEAAERRIEERQATLQAIEDQIASLVEQRKQMEEGQFAAIVAMYETMKPRDAASIFNALDMEVLLRVTRMMSPRKMAPVLAEMDTKRAQELTVRLASAEADPLERMDPEDLAALPQIVGR